MEFRFEVVLMSRLTVPGEDFRAENSRFRWCFGFAVGATVWEGFRRSPRSNCSRVSDSSDFLWKITGLGGVSGFVFCSKGGTKVLFGQFSRVFAPGVGSSFWTFRLGIVLVVRATTPVDGFRSQNRRIGLCFGLAVGALFFSGF